MEQLVNSPPVIFRWFYFVYPPTFVQFFFRPSSHLPIYADFLFTGLFTPQLFPCKSALSKRTRNQHFLDLYYCTLLAGVLLELSINQNLTAYHVRIFHFFHVGVK